MWVVVKSNKRKFMLLPLATCLLSSSAHALNGHYVPGVEGIAGPAVPPEGVYYRGYAVHYDIREINDQDGSAIPGDNSGTVNALANRFVWITGYQLLGADYGMEAIVPIQDTSLDFSGLGLDANDSGLGDVFLGPLVLGWHGDTWDAVAAAGVWLDTGDFDAANPASPGKGYRTTMLTLGGSWHLDEERRWSLSALSRYEIKSRQDETNIRPGDSWLVEWGLSHRLSSGLELGLVGYDAWQLESDDASAGGNKAEKHAVGAEAGYFWPDRGLGLRGAFYHEYDAASAGVAPVPEGNLLRLQLTKAW